MQLSVDAVITTHNRPEFILLALESIIKQTYKEIRVIIVDDGSNIGINYLISKFLKTNKNYIEKSRNRIYYIYQRCGGISRARIISPSAVIMKREVFFKTGLFDENFEVCEDYEFWLRLSLDYPILFLPEKLIVKQGGHNSQLSRKYEAMDRFRIEAIEKLINTRKLDADKYSAAVNELIKKINIYINGCKKRGKTNEAERYSRMLEKYIR